MVKSLEFFFFFQSYNKFFISEFDFVLVKSYSILPVCLQCTMKKALFLHFCKISIDHLFDNLESGNELLFWKKVWKKSCSLDLKFGMNPAKSNFRETCCVHHLTL